MRPRVEPELTASQTETVGARERVIPLLRAEGISSGYNRLAIIQEVSIQIGSGETVLIIGPNGAGKSTFVKSITGDLPVLAGAVFFEGQEITGASADVRAKLGIGYVPQLNDVFPTLTVMENLEMGGYTLPAKTAKARIAELFDRFPQLVPLRRRMAKQLSGGERKLVAITRALVAEPSMLILDEPTANLSPQVARRIITEVVAELAETGRAVLLIEQRVTLALPVADWVHILVAGRTRHSGPASEIDPATIASEFFFDRAREARIAAEEHPDSIAASGGDGGGSRHPDATE